MTLCRSELLTIYKSLIRPYLDYADIFLDHPANDSFSKKLKYIQYKAALAITGAMKGMSHEKNYN